MKSRAYRHTTRTWLAVNRNSGDVSSRCSSQYTGSHTALACGNHSTASLLPLRANEATVSWSGDGGLGGASEGLTQPAGCSCPRLCCFLGPSGAAVAAAVAGATATATVAPPAAVTAAVAGATAAVTAVPPAADAAAVAGALCSGAT